MSVGCEKLASGPFNALSAQSRNKVSNFRQVMAQHASNFMCGHKVDAAGATTKFRLSANHGGGTKGVTPSESEDQQCRILQSS
jgi:hypothetical protein